jgi:hypothetical protein
MFTFLNENQGSVMAVLTLVYVIATGLICHANYKSVKAMNRQVDEQERQFDENNRPLIEITLSALGKFVFLIMRNSGNRFADSIKIAFHNEYVNKISDTSFKRRLHSFSEEEWHLLAGKDTSFYFCNFDEYKSLKGNSVNIHINYQDCNKKKYDGEQLINFDSYESLTYAAPPIERIGETLGRIEAHIKCLTLLNETKGMYGKDDSK